MFAGTFIFIKLGIFSVTYKWIAYVGKVGTNLMGFTCNKVHFHKCILPDLFYCFICGAVMQQGWFAGYFPAQKPRFLCVVLAENGISGSDSACPVFKKIGNEMIKSGF